MFIWYRYFFLIVFLFLAACQGSSNELGQENTAETATTEAAASLVQVLSESGLSLATFSVEVADDPEERALGLMFRESLATDAGMLFVFPQDSENPFWMRNTLISLDIIFVDVDKRVINVVAEAEPETETLRYPAGPYRYVLEINGGLSQTLGIEAGSVLVF